MSAHTKKHHTEVQIIIGTKKRSYKNVPKSKVKPLIKSLTDYEDDDDNLSIPWRDAFKNDIKKAGSESALMVKAARIGENMTQNQLAELLNMPQSNLSQIENNKRPVGKKLAKKLGKIFNIGYRVFL